MIEILTDQQRKMIKCDKVNCKYDCPHCGFHPQERARRLTGGFWVHDNEMVLREYENDGTILSERIVKGLRGIRFRRREYEDTFGSDRN